MLVRRWDDFYMIYSFATKKLVKDFSLNVFNNINAFLKLGDAVYNDILDIYGSYCDKDTPPPAIDTFYPFEGNGKPPQRHSKNQILTLNNNDKSIITVDFKHKTTLR